MPITLTIHAETLAGLAAALDRLRAALRNHAEVSAVAASLGLAVSQGSDGQAELVLSAGAPSDPV